MKLKRKDFFKGIALGTISLPLLMRGLMPKNYAQEQQGPNIISGRHYKWKMVTTWSPNFPILGEVCNLFAEMVREMSAGRLDIEVFGGGTLVPPLEAFNAVKGGFAQIGHGAAYYWAGKVPAAQFFASIPFGMNAQQSNAWMVQGGGQELWEELYALHGLLPMAGGNTGVQMGGWFNREINSLEDFRGLKMRIPGLGSKVVEKAGGAAVLIPGPDLYTSLERGVIDATEWIGPFHDYKMGFHQIAQYYYSPGWHEAGTVLEFFSNKEAYEQLPKDLQAIIRAAAGYCNNWVLSSFEAKNAEYLGIILQDFEKHNQKYPEKQKEVRTFSDDILRQLRQYNEEAIQELIADDPFAQKVYASFLKFQEQSALWSTYTEKVFYNSLQQSLSGES